MEEHHWQARAHMLQPPSLLLREPLNFKYGMPISCYNKNILLLSLGCLLFASLLQAQGRYDRLFPDRYRLELPPELSRPKVLDAINQVLPKTIEELKDKDFCTECRGIYTVKLDLDTPRIGNRSNINKGYTPGRTKSEGGRLLQGSANQITMQVTYRFKASLGIYDSTGKRVTSLLLVPFGEEQIKSKDTIMGGMYYGNETVRDREGRITRMLVPYYEPIPLSNTLQPGYEDLVRIAEQRIFFIRDLVRKLN